MAKRASRKAGTGKRSNGTKRDLTGRKAGKPSKADLKAAAAAITVGDKQKTLRECRDEMAQINAQNELLVARRRSVREKVEGIGLSKAGFDLAIKLSDMDGTERADYLDALGFTLETFGLTKQGDLFGADHAEEGAANDAGDHCDRADAEGFRAAADGANASTNPYPPETRENEAWAAGWMRQQSKHAASLGPTDGATAH